MRSGSARPARGPVSAFTRAPAAAGIEVGIDDFTEHATARGQGSAATAYVECRARPPPPVRCTVRG
ncbi:hypothetical protein ACFU6I_19395 [Streptomyces sp. NPDC057486]|uniref:hypothetical protein n=1 Tax=Streptomyces sp. NPDC057486 TaxID=3346145 RepID=UPI0036A2A17D